jgi:type II secretory pathway pseudopilin PulG
MNFDVISIVSALAAVAGAVVAFWQALSARRDRKSAQASSADAAARAAEAQASWSRIADAQEAIAAAQRPSAWGAINDKSGNLWTLRNTSGRAIIVATVLATPERAQPLLGGTHVPVRVQPGKYLDVYADSRLGLSVRRVRIVWHFDGEEVTHESDRDLE